MPAPEIPEWIKSISHPAYRNIFSFRLGNVNLWGTETLLGDWNARYLLVAKDFYPARFVEDRVGQGFPWPYSHNPEAPTNRNLLKTLRHFNQVRDPHVPQDCGFMYISACFLLRDDGVVRGALPDMVGVMKRSAPVVLFTIDNMPNLQTVVLMGKDAEVGFRLGGGLEVARERGLRLHQVSHPSRAMTDDDRFREWEPLFA